MKKNYFFFTVILLTSVISASLTSCSKQTDQFAPSPAETIIAPDTTTQRSGSWGSITGMILPLHALVNFLLNDRRVEPSEMYYSKDGNFHIDKLRADVYTLTIIDLSNGREYITRDIRIYPGTVINLGIIKLQ